MTREERIIASWQKVARAGFQTMKQRDDWHWYFILMDDNQLDNRLPPLFSNKTPTIDDAHMEQLRAFRQRSNNGEFRIVCSDNDKIIPLTDWMKS